VNGVRDHWAVVGGFTAALPTFESVEQAQERYRAALIHYLDGTRLQDARYRLTVEGPGPAVDPASVEIEYRRAVPLKPIPSHRWGGSSQCTTIAWSDISAVELEADFRNGAAGRKCFADLISGMAGESDPRGTR
jgi:hypothetical protein